MQPEKSYSGLVSEIKDPAATYDVTPPTHQALILMHSEFKDRDTKKTHYGSFGEL